MTNVFVGSFFRPFSGWLASRLLNTSITPNQVTLISLLLAFAGSVFFVFGYWQFLVVGAFLWLFSEFLDFVDGDLARARKRVTVSGIMFDAVSDTLKKPLLVVSLSLGLFGVSGNYIALLLGLFAVSNIYLLEIIRGFIETIPKTRDPVCAVGDSVLGLLDTMVVIAFVGAILNQVILVLIAFAFVLPFIWLKRLLSAIKIIKEVKT